LLVVAESAKQHLYQLLQARKTEMMVIVEQLWATSTPGMGFPGEFPTPIDLIPVLDLRSSTPLILIEATKQLGCRKINILRSNSKLAFKIHRNIFQSESYKLQNLGFHRPPILADQGLCGFNTD